MANESERRDNTLINEIVTRLAVVEGYIHAREKQETEDRKWIRTLALAFVLQVVLLLAGGVTAAIKLGGFVQQLESIDLTHLQRETSTTLQVLADHGTELETVRAEQLRMREHMDDVVDEMRNRTQDRFYKSDAIEMNNRIKSLEEEHLEYFYTKKSEYE